MPRGITETDVWKACDALLLAGARPTIDRVRQHIGSGSPNTVSPHLDTWFRHLGGRLKDPGAFAPPPDVPEPVLQAARHFWEVAQAQARADFDARLQAGLAEAVATAAAERERAHQAQAAVSEATARAERLEADIAERLALYDQERRGRLAAEVQVGEGRRHIDSLRDRLDKATAETAAVRDAAQREVTQAIERFTAAERRAALEVDVERTARAKSDKHAEALARKVEALQGQAQASAATHREALAHATQQLSLRTADAQEAIARVANLENRLATLQTELLDRTRQVEVARAEAALAERLLAAATAQAVTTRKRALRPTVTKR